MVGGQPPVWWIHGVGNHDTTLAEVWKGPEDVLRLNDGFVVDGDGGPGFEARRVVLPVSERRGALRLNWHEAVVIVGVQPPECAGVYQTPPLLAHLQ